MRYRERIVPGELDLVSLLPEDGYLWCQVDKGFVAWGSAARIEVPRGADRFERAHEELTRFFASVAREDTSSGPLAIGSFTYSPDDDGSMLIVPEVVVRKTGGDCSIGVLGDAEFPELQPHRRPDAVKVRYAGSTLPEVDYLEAVQRAIKALRAGELAKVVLARDLLIWGEEAFPVPRLLANLVDRFPGCYTFCIDGFLGATPELLIERSGARLRSLVLAGTVGRGATEAEDERLAQELFASAKERSEHAPAVESVTEVLEPLCDVLEVESSPHLLKLANVQHLATSISGNSKSDLSALQLAGALHPTAAICGRPTADAAAMIAALEGMERGRYAGPVGWVDADGNGQWAIALRCAEIDGSRGRLFAGGGIVTGSDPAAELEETRLKFRAMMSALEG